MLTLAIIFFLIMGLLSVPVDLFFKSNKNFKNYVDVEIRWFFGLFKFWPLAMHLEDAPESSRVKAIKITKKKEKNKNKIDMLFARRVVFNYEIRTILFHHLLNLVKTIHFMSGKLAIKFGFRDPGETGKILGQMLAVKYACCDNIGDKLILNPDFDQEVFEWDGHVHIRLIPMEIFIKSLSLFFSPGLWKGLYHAKQV